MIPNLEDGLHRESRDSMVELIQIAMRFSVLLVALVIRLDKRSAN
jgi:hypothetical protein